MFRFSFQRNWPTETERHLTLLSADPRVNLTNDTNGVTGLHNSYPRVISALKVLLFARFLGLHLQFVRPGTSCGCLRVSLLSIVLRGDNRNKFVFCFVFKNICGSWNICRFCRRSKLVFNKRKPIW